MWLEMSRDAAHGGAGWAFAECLWSPSHKDPAGHWPFWELLRSVRKGDTVVHLRGKGKAAAFVGYSTADADGYETVDRPPAPGQWAYASSFYRVPLTGFAPFVEPIPLRRVFEAQAEKLGAYFDGNRARPPRQREHVFFVRQAGRLQCLNGAYLSLLSADLAEVVLGATLDAPSDGGRTASGWARTREQVRQVLARVGQGEFSENVRSNYGRRCCFPDCPIEEDLLLVGAHIARWADAPELRGQTSNGLCLCLLHDRAFEHGLYTLDAEFKVVLSEPKVCASRWATSSLRGAELRQIRLGEVLPARAALASHWRRTGFSRLSAGAPSP